ncbi:MAG: 5'-3' exonuclease H3TH domain-containing protein, partial [Prevotellaceae bacterium]|nr:5'-3' exonuclease H3TH domain-containing protein [Prevotellaceae bacterium]
MEKLFLLDAYALIYRAYYALIKNPRVNSKGMNTSAIMGFVNTLNEVISKENPTHIGVAFDPAGPTFRHEMYPEYKAQREACPEDIKMSVPIIKNILRCMKIPVLEVQGYEADDVIGTLATQAGKQGINTYMLTPDKDYGQLVSDNVMMYRPRFGNNGYDVMGPEEVKAKFGITTPLQVIDLLGLMGDASDNIPGCPGVGEKTAQKIIAEFGSIDNLLNNTNQLKGALKKKVEENREGIMFSKFLATIKTDVPITLNLEDLKLEQADEKELLKIYNELEFKRLSDQLLNKTKNIKKTINQQLDLFAEFATDGQDKPKFANYESLKDGGQRYELIDNEEDIIKIRDLFLTTKNLSLDTETTSTEAINAELVGLSFAIKEKEAYYVPIPAEREEAQKIVNIFKPVYEN